MSGQYIFSKRLVINFSMYPILLSILGFSNFGNGFFYFPEIFDSFSTILMLGSFLLAFLISFSGNVKVNTFLFMGIVFHIIIVNLSLLINHVNIFESVYRINVSVIPLFMVVISSYIAKYMKPEEWINRILSTFIIWLSLQTIGSVLGTYITKGVLLKKEIAVSIGNSNFIASVLLIGLVYFILLPKCKKSKLRISTLFLGLIGLGFTFSFGSIVTFVLIMYLYYFTQNKRVSKVAIVLMIASFLIYGVFLLLLNGLLLEMFSDTIFNDFIYKSTFKIQQLTVGNYDAAFAGRGIVYSSKLELISNRVMLGYGSNVESVGQIRSHNWILDSLIYTGILGTAIYLSLVGYVLIKIRKGKNLVSNGNSSYFALLAGIIHGFIEPNFFSKPFDFIWWLIALTTLYSISIKSENSSMKFSVTNV